MQCNIDSNGARMRLVWGIGACAAGVILGGLALWAGTWWLWLIAAGCVGAGGFAIFESRKKWCVLRAMGIKTSI
ncbi:MAG TPA: hypothetical protein VM008_16615 [Phycisphaerae bacterium]|nr:hypothetical protein [Phycisphaerae bacterium]